MAQYIMNGGSPLVGEVAIGGAKNAALGILAAAIMTDEDVCIENLPDVKDINVMLEAIKAIGASVERLDRHSVKINASSVKDILVDDEFIRRIRASYYFIGALLGKYKSAEVALPGGCNIGSRPIDLHLKGFKALGAEIEIESGRVKAHAIDLVAADIYLDTVSVGATINIMMAASLAEGRTLIENAAKEPEIVDLANMLNKMGAKIKGAGTDTIRITGVDELSGAIHTVIPDRIECGTFMLAAAITRGKVLIRNGIPGHVRPIIAKLKECGVSVNTDEDGILVDATKGNLVATDIKTLPYPGFPTDIQSPFMAFLTTVEGTSVVRETVFENRFMHVVELNRMGADISADNSREATIPGGKQLHGAKVRSTDLRAGAAMVLAGLVATGTTEVSEIYHIERGYEDFVGKFKSLGADLMRVEEHDV